MTDVMRIRVNRELLQQANDVAAQIGTSPAEIVRLMLKQLVKRRAIPFPLQADAPETEVLSTPQRRSKLWDEYE